MISELAKATSRVSRAIAKILRRAKPAEKQESALRSDIEALAARLSERQNETEAGIEALAIKASEMLGELQKREQSQIELWKKEAGDFLEGVGIDRNHTDEFLGKPTLEKLEELRSKCVGKTE